jgi:hypothetical protein
VIQGYSGGTHQGRSQYALDLVLAGGGTSGAQVVSPVDGRVVWAMAPGAGNGCMGIAMNGSSHSVALCHVQWTHAFRRGEAVSRGQALGTVGAAGRLGNNGTPHVHLELHRGGQARDPVPFSAASGGLPLVGIDTPGAPAARVASVAAPAPPIRAAAAPAPAPKPAAAAPAAAAAAAPAPAARQTESIRAAIVSGTDSCLNVRAAPSVDAPVQTCLPDGSRVSLAPRGSEGGAAWRQIADKGWASAEFLKLTNAVVSGTSSCLNVRESPSTSGRVVGCLSEGTSVQLGEGPQRADGLGWFKVAAGWVADAFLG